MIHSDTASSSEYPKGSISAWSWLGLGSFVLAYVLLAEVSLHIAFDVKQSGFIVFWLPIGLFLGVLTLVNRRYAWAVIVAALVGNLIFDFLTQHVSLPLTVGYWLVNTFGALVGDWFLRKTGGCDSGLEELHEVWMFFAGGVVLVPTVTATAAAVLLNWSQRIPFVASWFKIWLGNSLGILMVTPVVLAWCAPQRHEWERAGQPKRSRWIEIVALSSAMLGIAWLIHLLPGAQAVDSPFFPFWQFLPIVWAGLRFRPRIACLLAAAAMLITTARTASGFGPFASPGQSVQNQILLVQAYVGVVLLTVLTLSAAVCQQRRAELAASASESRLRDFLENAHDLIQWVHPDGSYLFVNRAWRETLGYSSEEVAKLRTSDLLHPDSQEVCERLRIKAQSDVEERGEVVLLARDRRPIVVEVSVSLLRENGEVTCYRGILRDITARKAAEAERERLIDDLHKALQEVKTLRGYIPICSSCKKIRTEAGAWRELEEYISENTDAELTHGICTDCTRVQFGEYLQDIEALRAEPEQRDKETDNS